jgi:hypothetical protein
MTANETIFPPVRAGLAEAAGADVLEAAPVGAITPR